MPWYDFARNSWNRLRHMCNALGTGFVCVVVLIEHLLQAFVFGGGSGGFIGLPIFFLLRAYGTVTAARMQVLKTIAVSPWALKPLFGMISDVVYVGGYQRMPYILCTLVLAVISCFSIVLYWPLGPELDTLAFFMMFLQIAVADLLLEAQYIVRLRPFPEIKPDLVSFVEIGSNLFQIASILCVGLVMSLVSAYQYLYLVGVPAFMLTLYPVYDNWIGEVEYTHNEPFLITLAPIGDASEYEQAEPVLETELPDNTLYSLFPATYTTKHGPEETGQKTPIIGADYQLPMRHWRTFLLASVVAVLSLLTSTIGLVTTNTLALSIVSLISAPIMMLAFALLTDARTAKLQCFVLIQNMFSVSISSAEFFFLTDTAAQYPEGPHFSNFFVVTVMGLMATVLALVGAVTYQMFMTGWSYRKVLILTNLANMFFSGFSIVFYNRWNLLIGFPDWLFVVGSEALQVITSQWAGMPFKVMMLQLCPAETAATSYALLAGSSNLGAALSQYQGAGLLDLLGIKPTGAANEGAQFDKLWIAILINIALPLVPLILIPFLIPDAGQTVSLLPDAVIVPLEPQELEMPDVIDTSDGELTEFVL